jgi:signal transduction histidine kinase
MTEPLPPSGTEEQRQKALALLGELTGSVAHEFNNILNNILLHVAVLEQKGLPEALRPETGQLKQVGRQAATLVRQLQQFGASLQPPPVPVDLNRLVSETVAAPVRFELALDLPSVLGHPADLKRIVELLVANAVAVSGRPEAVVVRTGRAGQAVLLEVSDPGPPLAPDMHKRQFEPFVIARPGGDGVGLAVCKDIVRRQQGLIHGENRAPGVVYAVELRDAENVV